VETGDWKEGGRERGMRKGKGKVKGMLGKLAIAIPAGVAVAFATVLVLMGAGAQAPGLRMSALAQVVDQYGNVLDTVPLSSGERSPLSILFMYGSTTYDLTQYMSPGNAKLRYLMVKPAVEVKAEGYDPNSPPMVRVVWTWTSFTFNGTVVPVKSAQLMSANYPVGTPYQDWFFAPNGQKVLEGEGFVVFIPLDSNVFSLQPGQTGQLVLRCTVAAELRDSVDISKVLDSKSAAGEFTATLKNTG
jgi:hypothetical protein